MNDGSVYLGTVQKEGGGVREENLGVKSLTAAGKTMGEGEGV